MTALLGALTAVVVLAENPPVRLPLSLSAADGSRWPALVQEAELTAPGEVSFVFSPPVQPWTAIRSLEFEVYWPEGAPASGQLLLYLKDWEYYWYQNLWPQALEPGRQNRCEVDLSPGADGWLPRDHHGVWNLRVLMEPKEFGIKLFCKEPWKGRVRVEKAFAIVREEEHDAPAITQVRSNSARIPCYQPLEITFALPDRYPDPFDPDQIRVWAEFEDSKGGKATVDGYYAQDYYRQVSVADEQMVPQGPPYWRIRFAPVVPGAYRYYLFAKDKRGQSRWGPASFVATTPLLPGFVRVSKRDPRYFEFDNGAAFFPLGHNLSTPVDNRMDTLFPWRQRFPEGSTVYPKCFRKMKEAGENFAEVWTAAWSLGLEWNATWRGYHGVGQYNLVHAWELDRVLEAAEANGIYVNIVILNHGKFSSWCDPEWEANPFNTANGGYLTKPDDYFDDPRALRDFRKLMRYMVARWGASTRVFSWQLWSEVDLTGSTGSNYRRPEVVEWHRQMGRAIKDMDPNDHLIGTHVCTDYTHQNTEIIALPEMDWAPNDAYHFQADPLYIIDLIRATAAFNNPYNKPVMITEFGGSAYGNSLKHLEDAMHAALWGGAALPLGGSPMFWWWHLVDEENWYPKFQALNRFMAGEDRRDPEATSYTPELLVGGSRPGDLDVQCLKGKNRALGWLFVRSTFGQTDPRGLVRQKDVTVRFADLQEGEYEVQFWDTQDGKIVDRKTVRAAQGVVSAPVPAFARDLAFKVKRIR